MQERILRLLRGPAAPIVPWGSLALVLLAALIAVHQFGAEGAEQQQRDLEKAWMSARQALTQHREARKLRQDLSRVWAMLPAEHDFGPLALGVSEEAKKDRVTLPALSSKTEPTPVPLVSKGVLQGSMSGRYEDLRRFIYDLETAEEPLFIEDLELARTASQAGPNPTFTIRIVTYLRNESGQGQVQGR